MWSASLGVWHGFLKSRTPLLLLFRFWTKLSWDRKKQTGWESTRAAPLPLASGWDQNQYGMGTTTIATGCGEAEEDAEEGAQQYLFRYFIFSRSPCFIIICTFSYCHMENLERFHTANRGGRRRSNQPAEQDGGNESM